jgi:hypothetical protein
MEKIYSLAVFIRGRAELFHFPVDKSDYDRLAGILDNSESALDPGFFWCDTTDGRSVIINPHAIQVVRFLWDGPFAPDTEDYDGSIQIFLTGRNEPIEADTASAESIYEFFSQLEMDPRMFPFPNFEDEDGEYVYVNASEVDLVVAPKELMDEGARIALEGLEEKPARSKPNLVRKK